MELTEREEIILESLRPFGITVNDMKYVPLDRVYAIASELHEEAYRAGLTRNVADHFKSIGELRAMMIDDVIEQLQQMKAKELERAPIQEDM